MRRCVVFTYFSDVESAPIIYLPDHLLLETSSQISFSQTFCILFYTLRMRICKETSSVDVPLVYLILRIYELPVRIL